MVTIKEVKNKLKELKLELKLEEEHREKMFIAFNKAQSNLVKADGVIEYLKGKIESSNKILQKANKKKEKELENVDIDDMEDEIELTDDIEIKGGNKPKSKLKVTKVSDG